MKSHLTQILVVTAFICNTSLAQQNADASLSSNDLVADNMLLWQRDNGGWPNDTYNIFFDIPGPTSTTTSTKKKQRLTKY